MKKTLLLSVVASGLLFAGGDIAPVEPAVVTPAPAPAPVAESGWKFSGQAVVYYETIGGGDLPFDLFDQESSAANAGLQLTATNDNLIGGIGFGAQLNGLGTLGLEEDVVTYPMQMGDSLNSAYFSQLYLTYGIANTSFKVGRQELPKSLSPFAYSEDWNVFTNTFNAALVVNTDIKDTVLVGAWVRDANLNGHAAINLLTGYPAGAMNEFTKMNDDRGIWMLTAQNKSIENLTLTGSWYYGNDFTVPYLNIVSNEDLHILWADAQYNAGVANIGLQGGTVRNDAIDNTTAFGAKVSGKIDIVNASVAYAHVNDSTFGVFNVGGSTSALYTDTVLNQAVPFVFSGMIVNNDMDKFVVRADADVLGGNLGGAFAYTDYDSANAELKEFDLTYSTKITNDLSVATTYVYADLESDTAHAIRAVARYNF